MHSQESRVSETLFVDYVTHGGESAVPNHWPGIFNPATGEVSGHQALGSGAEVYKAAPATRDAFPDWAATPPHVRARVSGRAFCR